MATQSRSLSPQIRAEIGDTLATARGTANSLRGSADRIEEATLAELPAGAAAGIEHATHTAMLLGAEVVRATLAILALGGHAGRLHAFGRAMTLDAENESSRLAIVRAVIESEARDDARTYLDGHTGEDPAAWARGAWAHTEASWVGALGVDAHEAKAWYLAAFMVAAMGGNGGAR